MRREIATGRDLVALSRGDVTVGRGGIAFRRCVAAHPADMRSRVGRLLAAARGPTARFPSALIDQDDHTLTNKNKDNKEVPALSAA